MGFEWKEVRWGGSEEVRDRWSNAGAGAGKREIMEESGFFAGENRPGSVGA